MSVGFNDLAEVERQTNASNLLVVDALNFAFRFKHKKQTNFGPDFLRAITSFATSFEANNVVICADKGGSTYRKGIAPDYKGNRAAKYKEQSAEEAAEFQKFLEDFDDAMELCAQRYPLVRFQGVEADDTMTYITLHAKHAEHIHILSTDRDLDQLITDKVTRFSYVTRKVVTLDNFFETYGCDPEEYISVKVLQGDSGDNVPGVALVGPKRASGIVRQYGTAFDIHASLPLPGKQQFIKNINEFGDQILVNYELMDLPAYCEDAIGEENLGVLQTIMDMNSI